MANNRLISFIFTFASYKRYRFCSLFAIFTMTSMSLWIILVAVQLTMVFSIPHNHHHNKSYQVANLAENVIDQCSANETIKQDLNVFVYGCFLNKSLIHQENITKGMSFKVNYGYYV